jgi:hypothetical protein
MSPFVIEFQPTVHYHGPLIIAFDKDPRICSHEEVLETLSKQLGEFVRHLNSVRNMHVEKISLELGGVPLKLKSVVQRIRREYKIDRLKWDPVLNTIESIKKVASSKASAVQDVQSSAEDPPGNEMPVKLSLEEADSLVYSHYTAPLQEEINRLRHEKVRLQQLQESRFESAQREDMQIKALEIQNREQEKEITRLRNKLKKRVEPKRQRTVYSKENAPTNSRVEQISVPQPIVSKSGRQVKPSRKALGIDDD